MKVRKYNVGEEMILWNIFYNTIHNVNSKDYDTNQISAWAPSNLDSDIWINKIRSINPFVVEHENMILGYADLQESGLIDHFFCHHEWQRKGVGSMLMNAIIDNAKLRDINTLFSEVSITAKPFYLSYGFTVVEEQLLSVNGQYLTNYKMQKKVTC